MIRAGLTLALLTVPAAAQAQVTLTLAQARALPGPALAEKLLGPEAARDIVEVVVAGDAWGMIAQPGLNGVIFYRTPRATEFPGLCRVEHLYARFSSGGERGSDVPHALMATRTHTEFALLARPGPAPDGDCAGLAPLADRDSPRLFTLGDASNLDNGDSAATAYFGMVALAQAQIDTSAGRAHVRCKPDPADKARTECRDPLLTITRYPAARIDTMQVYPCEERAPQLCIDVNHVIDPGKHTGRTLRLVIATDAVAATPSAPFEVRSITVQPETWAND